MVTILLVDDEHLIRRSVGRLLSRWYRVLIARSGEEALVFFQQEPSIDIILTDIMMPGIGGEGLYHRLPVEAQARVILMTGAFEKAELCQVQEQIAAPLLIKPFFLNELQSTIQQILQTAPRVLA